MLEGALKDLKVVELSERVAGPFCTKVMADLGAEVIKLEKPGTGDVARTHGPFPRDAPHLEKSTRFGIMHLLQNAGVAATPVYDTESLVTDPQFQHREYLVSPGHPVTGNHPVAGIPGKYSGFEPRYTPAPCLGQDNEDVFGNLLGLSRQEIARLQEEKVIY